MTDKPRRRNFLYNVGMHWRIFIYMLCFAVIMVVLLWLFQVVYLDEFYERIKKDQLSAAYINIANNLDEEDLDDYVKEMARHYDICATVFRVQKNNDVLLGIKQVASAEILANCIIHHAPTAKIFEYYNQARAAAGSGYWESIPDTISRLDFSEGNLLMVREEGSSTSEIFANLATDRYGTEYFILLNSSITPVTATVSTLRVQLLIITAILFVLALIISALISRRLSNPIRRLNRQAKALGQGDLSGNFSPEGYKEIAELADTLNYASHELQRTDTLQKDIIANISHDIRTPLTMISGYAEYMRDFPTEDHQESLQVILDETQRLRDLVNDILDNSKMTAGVNVLEPERFDFSESITAFVNNYNHLIERRGYRVNLTIANGIWINADEKRILQAISNMLNNALTHIGQDKFIEVRGIVRGKTLRVEIADHGAGIAPEDLPHLWERYYRTDAPQRDNHGSGLGLSIVKGIMEMHQAKYGVESELGKGSTFWFELPIDKRSEVGGKR